MKVRTDLHAGQAIALDPQQLAQWAQAQMQSPTAASALASPTAKLLQLAQGPLDAQSLSSALQTAAGPLSPGQFLSMVGTVQSYLQPV
jgi:hypothetical protein